MSVELARRAVACRHWRWLPGMKATSLDSRPARIEALEWGDEFAQTIIPTESGPVFASPPDYNYHAWGPFPAPETLPDLTDAATLGCLLQLVREARQEPWYYPTAQVYGGQVLWLVERPVRERQTLHESEASALVAALEAAP